MDAELTAKQTKRLQKKAKKRLAKGGGTRDDALSVYGEHAIAAFELLEELPSKPPRNNNLVAQHSLAAAPPAPVESLLHVDDVQNLLLWSLTHDLGQMPKWVRVSNKPLLRGAVVLIAPTLTAEAALASLTSIGGGGVAGDGDAGGSSGDLSASAFTAARAVKLPRAHRSRTASAVASDLFQVKLPRKRKAAALEAEAAAATSNAVDAVGPATATTPLSPHPGRHPAGGWKLSYVQTFAARGEELRDNGFPISGDAHLGPMYVSASAAAMAAAAAAASPPTAGTATATGTAHPCARLVAIDCEMVLVRERMDEPTLLRPTSLLLMCSCPAASDGAHSTPPLFASLPSLPSFALT